MLLQKSGYNVGDAIAKKYLRAEIMDPLVKRYRKLYCEDLSQRLSVNDKSLPYHLSFGVHLNPLFGTEEGWCDLHVPIARILHVVQALTI